jgi:hypothetical protein
LKTKRRCGNCVLSTHFFTCLAMAYEYVMLADLVIQVLLS